MGPAKAEIALILPLNAKEDDLGNRLSAEIQEVLESHGPSSILTPQPQMPLTLEDCNGPRNWLTVNNYMLKMFLGLYFQLS